MMTGILSYLYSWRCRRLGRRCHGCGELRGRLWGVTIIIVIIIIIVSEALFCLCRGTNIYNSFGVCPNFKTRTTAFYTF